MSKCPYTWVKGFFSIPKTHKNEASALRVTVLKGEETTVDVELPAGSARWLISLIPEDVMIKIRSEGIPIDSIQDQLANKTILVPQPIFELVETNRKVAVWLE